MAFFLLIGVRLDNIVGLGSQPSTFCCLLDEKGEKNSNRPHSAGAWMSLERVAPKRGWPRTLCSDCPPLTMGSLLGCRFPTAPLPLLPARQSCSWKQSWLTWWMIQVTAHREPGFLAVKDWCDDYPLCREKQTKTPFSSLFSCKLQEPSQQIEIRESLQENGF